MIASLSSRGISSASVLLCRSFTSIVVNPRRLPAITVHHLIALFSDIDERPEAARDSHRKSENHAQAINFIPKQHGIIPNRTITKRKQGKGQRPGHRLSIAKSQTRDGVDKRSDFQVENPNEARRLVDDLVRTYLILGSPRLNKRIERAQPLNGVHDSLGNKNDIISHSAGLKRMHQSPRVGLIVSAPLGHRPITSPLFSCTRFPRRSALLHRDKAKHQLWLASVPCQFPAHATLFACQSLDFAVAIFEASYTIVQSPSLTTPQKIPHQNPQKKRQPSHDVCHIVLHT